MEKNIPVLIFEDTNSGEPGEVYLLNEENAGNMFFANLSINVSENQDHIIRLEKFNELEVERAKLMGDVIGGMTDEESESVYKRLDEIKRLLDDN